MGGDKHKKTRLKNGLRPYASFRILFFSKNNITNDFFFSMAINRRPHDGLDRPALPLFPSAHLSPR
jgi:hypothetical protein